MKTRFKTCTAETPQKGLKSEVVDAVEDLGLAQERKKENQIQDVYSKQIAESFLAL